jgi:hypothetical protein
VVGDRHEADARLARLDVGRAAGRLGVAAGAGGGDAGLREGVERVAQGVLPEVEGMVVGRAHRADADRPERLDRRGRRRPEEERLALDERGGAPAHGEAALEIADDQVERCAELAQAAVPQRLRWVAAQRLGHAAAEHHVAQQADRDAPRAAHARRSTVHVVDGRDRR